MVTFQENEILFNGRLLRKALFKTGLLKNAQNLTGIIIIKVKDKP
jgi:hypothetical protein